MSRNLFKAFREVFPDAPLQAGTVVAFAGGVATVELPGGGRVLARGEGAPGDEVFVRDGVIEAEAPALTPVDIEI